MFCTHCGQGLNNNARFCGSCGKSIAQIEVVEDIKKPFSEPHLNNINPIKEVESNKDKNGITAFICLFCGHGKASDKSFVIEDFASGKWPILFVAGVIFLLFSFMFEIKLLFISAALLGYAWHTKSKGTLAALTCAKCSEVSYKSRDGLWNKSSKRNNWFNG